MRFCYKIQKYTEPLVGAWLVKIVFLGINYWPEETGIAPYTVGKCEYLAARGHEVFIVTAPPYYPYWRIQPPYKAGICYRESRNGVTILRVPLYVPGDPTTVKRILHETSFGIMAALGMLGAGRPDLLFVISPPLILAMLAKSLSRLWGVPYVLHVTDLQPDTAKELGMLGSRRFVEVLERIALACYREAALVSSVSKGMKDRIARKGISEERLGVFSDWLDPEIRRSVSRERGLQVRKQEGWGGRFVVMHVGNMGVKQGLDVVLTAAQQDEQIDPSLWVLVGDGAARRALERKAQTLGLTNVRFYPVLPRRRFYEFLSAADVCLICQRREVLDFVFPSKTRVLMGAGKPIVASVNDESEVARVLRESGGGWVVEPERGETLVSKVRELRQNAAMVEEAGKNGALYAYAHWEKEKMLEAFCDTIERLGKRRKTGKRASKKGGQS